MGDLQGLFDPAKEQLDRPSPLVQVGDFLCACLQIIGEDAQHLAGFDDDPKLAAETRHRIVARRGEPLRKIADPIVQDCRSRRNGTILDDRKRRIGLQSRDDAAACFIEPRPPSVVVIAKIKHIGRFRLDRHLLGGRDVVDVGRCHHQVQRLVSIGIVDDVGFGPADAGRKRCPMAAQAAQLHAGRIDQANAIADFPSIAGLQLLHQRRKQAAKHFRRLAQSIGGGQR